MRQLTLQKRGLTPFLLALVLLAEGGVPAQGQSDPPASEIEQINALLDQSFNALAAVHDYRGTLVKQELFGDELIKERIEFKFSRPFKVYVKYITPHAGREGIFVRGSHGNRVRAHKGSVPDFSFSFSPFGRIPMQNNHHPITSFGLESMLQVTAINIRKVIAQGDALLSISHDGVVGGEPAWRIDLKSKSGGRYVTARRFEDLWDLAKRAGQNMYVILHHNEDIDSPRDIRQGQRVFVPRHYAGRGQYFFSKRTYMMMKAMSWDHDGKLYESYEFTELELNPGLTERDFDHRNRDYDFRPLD
jgi:outer membrane lipoprotein-sorting protein